MLGPLKEAFALFQNCKPFDQTFPLLGFFFLQQFWNVYHL